MWSADSQKYQPQGAGEGNPERQRDQAIQIRPGAGFEQVRDQRDQEGAEQKDQQGQEDEALALDGR